ncbi:MAG: glutamate--cysteine ligase [Gammaproteobacteria bacterium]|nr:glutamate--cysteine ligase [Gammaproteobacteria bacterium]
MGQEISDSEFDQAAFSEFRRRVDDETRLLADWLQQGRLVSSRRRFGFEIEGWLIDADGRPAARNRDFLDAVADPLVVPELSRFNFEINSEPAYLAAGALDDMHAALHRRWQHCRAAAQRIGVRPLLVGILPTVRSSDLTLASMSPLQRYRAINDQVFRLRDGKPIELDIHGVEHLHHLHHDVMLEAGTTSLQIHVQVDAAEAARAFNVCKMLSAITVGVGANSPFLFGRQLWQETRIALFEQAVAVGGSDYSKRVTFGVRYAESSILECFEANRTRYPVILPDLMDEPRERLAHLRLHNGTVWRWNRPLIGFDEHGEPHVRIEHRVVAAGPTPHDAIANTALFLGLFEALMRSDRTLEQDLPFERARENFYAAARHGLDAEIAWMDDAPAPLHTLLGDRLIDQAAQGLAAAGLAQREIDDWLGIVRARVEQRLTGADWQVAWIARHGRDFAALVEAYCASQVQDRPVHEWSLN